MQPQRENFRYVKMSSRCFHQDFRTFALIILNIISIISYEKIHEYQKCNLPTL